MNGKKAKALRQIARKQAGDTPSELVSLGKGKIARTAINQPYSTRNVYRQLKKSHA